MKGGLAAIILEMKKKRGMEGKPSKPAPAEAAEPEEGEVVEDEATEGADEEAAMGEFMDAVDAGDKGAALEAFKALVSACQPKE